MGSAAPASLQARKPRSERSIKAAYIAYCHGKLGCWKGAPKHREIMPAPAPAPTAYPSSVPFHREACQMPTSSQTASSNCAEDDSAHKHAKRARESPETEADGQGALGRVSQYARKL